MNKELTDMKEQVKGKTGNEGGEEKPEQSIEDGPKPKKISKAWKTILLSPKG
jgi:hypothetical protein